MRKLFSHFDICLKQNKLGYEYVFQPNTYSLRSFSKGRGSSKRPSRLYIGSDPPALKGLKPGYAVGEGSNWPLPYKSVVLKINVNIDFTYLESSCIYMLIQICQNTNCFWKKCTHLKFVEWTSVICEASL